MKFLKKLGQFRALGPLKLSVFKELLKVTQPLPVNTAHW
jgi:hypothetical protein